MNYPPNSKGNKVGEGRLFMDKNGYSSAGLLKDAVLDLSVFGTENLDSAMTAKDCILVALLRGGCYWRCLVHLFRGWDCTT